MILNDLRNTWLVHFNPKKCSATTISSRNSRPNRCTFCGQELASVETHPYLSVQLSNTLSRDAQIVSITQKAQVLGVIRRLPNSGESNSKIQLDSSCPRVRHSSMGPSFQKKHHGIRKNSETSSPILQK